MKECKAVEGRATDHQRKGTIGSCKGGSKALSGTSMQGQLKVQVAAIGSAKGSFMPWLAVSRTDSVLPWVAEGSAALFLCLLVVIYPLTVL